MKFDLGFLGGGQLARMSIQAAQRMGLKCLSLDPGHDTPASQIAAAEVGNLSDPEAIGRVVAQCCKITLENEFIPAEAIREGFRLARRDLADLTPGVETLATIQDKLHQREAFNHAGVPSPNAAALTDVPGILCRIAEEPEERWRPVMLKARFGGYDGKGTRYARTREEFAANVVGLGDDWLLEDFVPFHRELAVMVFISDTVTGAFPTMETVQTNHVCDLVYPCDADAREVAIAAVEAVGGKGLFGVELFQQPGGEILVNEIAPRPHNTGHYTLDWGGTSQFEQHVRLAMGLPVDLAPSGVDTCMANILGVDGDFSLSAALSRALEDPTVHAHWYGKAEMRAGRKMGHLNAVGGDNPRQAAIDARERFFQAAAST